MTERAPTDRALSALKAGGLDEAPLSSLEREDALFVLTGGTLVYQDGGGTRRVTLRDLTRIHSDQEGMLRVETPAGTALTASLLGFDPQAVQSFFAGVRDATARAKQMPASPLPTPGGVKTFGAAPATSAPQPPSQPEPKTIVLGKSNHMEDDDFEDDLPNTSASAVTSQSAPSQSARPAHTPDQIIAPPAPANPAKEPVVISSSGFSPGSGRTAAPSSATPSPVTSSSAPSSSSAPNPTPPNPASPNFVAPEALTPPTKTPVSAVETAARPERSAVVEPTPSSVPPRASEPALSKEAPKPAPATASVPPAESPKVAAPGLALRSSSGLISALAAQADVVDGLVSRLRLLGGILFVTAVALAFFQFTRDQQLNALWTLLSGGVGTIALLALADMARLLAALSRVSGASSGVLDDE